MIRLHKKTRSPLPRILLCIMLLTACGSGGENAAVDAYRASISDFIDSVESLSADLDSIDPSSADAADQLLSCLDRMDGAFHDAAQLDVPGSYSDCVASLKNASNFMAQANSTYHLAYADGGYDASLSESAKNYYDSAMSCLLDFGSAIAAHGAD